MILFRICCLMIAVDFTAPALLAFLSLILPRPLLLHTLAASVLHESAHFFALFLTKQRPAGLRVSAAGLRLTLKSGMLCPLPVLAMILLSGPLSNLAASGGCLMLGLPEAAQVHFSLALFNLLPYRSTDGGTLLFAGMEQILLPVRPDYLIPCMRLICILTTCVLAGLLVLGGTANLSFWGMLIFMTAAEFCAD